MWIRGSWGHLLSVVVLPLGLLVGSYGQEALRKPKKRFMDAEHIEFCWCERRGCRGWSFMEVDDSQRQPLFLFSFFIPAGLLLAAVQLVVHSAGVCLFFFSLYFLVGTRVNWQKGKVYKDSSLTFMSICDSVFDLMVLYFQLGLLWKSPLKIA